MTIEVFAPAKVNLTLHVTGQRADGYHELDSIVSFADVGDQITVKPADVLSLTVTGPFGAALPSEDNIVLLAARFMGVTAEIYLEKNLPVAAGLGGGSSDAAATLIALSELTGQPIPDHTEQLGADVPMCLHKTALRAQGVGERIEPLQGFNPLHAVLVNTGGTMITRDVFQNLTQRANDPMPQDIPRMSHVASMIAWLGQMRNDLEDPAMAMDPTITPVFDALKVTPGCMLTRLSGSGATCFGLYGDAETAASAAGRLQETYPAWWIKSVRLMGA